MTNAETCIICATCLTGVGGTAKAKPYGMDGDYSIKIQREG